MSEKLAKVRIESDGTPQGTKVFNIETGEQIHGVRSIEWSIGLHCAATAKIEVVVVEITALGDLQNTFYSPMEIK